MDSRTTSNPEGFGMTRRSHRKSRAGCSECKHRHIKCDENRPACGNCSISSRRCSFLSSQPKLPIVGQGTVTSPSPTHPPQSDASPSSHQSSPVSPSYEFSNIQDANMAQLEFFHHCMKGNFDLPPSSENLDKTVSPAVTTELALYYPFLMNEMLAFSALHLSYLKPAKAQFYKHHAVGLQTHALTMFNREMTKVNSENCIAILMFAWFMTLHTIFETTESADIKSFLDGFTHCMQLHRGVRAVTASAWHMMLESEMGHVLQEATRLLENAGDNGSHTVELKKFIQDSVRLSDDEKLVSKDALERIQWFLSRTDGIRSKDPSLISAFLSITSWPAIIDANFLRLVSEKTPEALLVLSYYAIPLHMCRDIWVVGGAGRLLIQSVRFHLDEKWHEWLDWPEKMINASE